VIISGTDLQTYLNPESVSTKFLASGYSAATTAAIANAESMVRGSMNERDRRMLSEVGGLYLTRDAVGGETAFTVPTYAQTADTSNTRVWKNYCGLWRDRKIVDAEPSTTATNTITLTTALAAGDTLIANIPHSGTNIPEILKTLCLTLAVHYMIIRQPRLVADIDRELFAVELQNANDNLKALRRGELRPYELDALDLVDDMETISVPGSGYLEIGW
jgi:hypothetical protein